MKPRTAAGYDGLGVLGELEKKDTDIMLARFHNTATAVKCANYVDMAPLFGENGMYDTAYYDLYLGASTHRGYNSVNGEANEIRVHMDRGEINLCIQKDYEKKFSKIEMKRLGAKAETAMNWFNKAVKHTIAIDADRYAYFKFLNSVAPENQGNKAGLETPQDLGTTANPIIESSLKNADGTPHAISSTVLKMMDVVGSYNYAGVSPDINNGNYVVVMDNHTYLHWVREMEQVYRYDPKMLGSILGKGSMGDNQIYSYTVVKSDTMPIIRGTNGKLLHQIYLCNPEFNYFPLQVVLAQFSAIRKDVWFDLSLIYDAGTLDPTAHAKAIIDLDLSL